MLPQGAQEAPWRTFGVWADRQSLESTKRVTRRASAPVRDMALSGRFLLRSIDDVNVGETDMDGQLDVGETWSYEANYAVAEVDSIGGQVPRRLTLERHSAHTKQEEC